jgi:hypothetical protein
MTEIGLIAERRVPDRRRTRECTKNSLRGQRSFVMEFTFRITMGGRQEMVASTQSGSKGMLVDCRTVETKDFALDCPGTPHERRLPGH